MPARLSARCRQGLRSQKSPSTSHRGGSEETTGGKETRPLGGFLTKGERHGGEEASSPMGSTGPSLGTLS